MGVEVELRRKSPSDLEADTQQTPKVVTEEPAVEQATPEPVLKKSSSSIRVPDCMYLRYTICC